MDIFFGGAGPVDDITIRSDGPTGLRPPPGAAWSRVSTLGHSTLRQGGGDVLLLQSDPDDPLAGTRFDLASEPDVFSMELSELRFASSDTSTFRLEPTVRPQGSSPRSMGTAGIQQSDQGVSLSVDQTAMQANTQRVLVTDDGVVVLDVFGVAPGLVATSDAGSEVCRVGVQTFPSQPDPHGFFFEFEEDAQITIPSSPKSAVVGDRILVLAQNPIAPMVGILDWSMNTSGMRWLWLWNLASDNATGVPPAWRDRIGLQVAPNPFNPRTTLRLDLPVGGPTTVRVFSVDGRLVDTLHRGWMPAGPNELPWTARDHRGSLLASGVYLLRVETPAGVRTGRATLLK
jgi:hypothetical protein